MNIILEECKKYDLIGIGELTHGELTSWKYRYKIVKYLTKYFNKVIIFCETLDPYISNLTPTEKKNETEKCKTILSGDVNAPSVRACFHLTAFYSG